MKAGDALLTLGDEGLIMLLLMNAVTCLGLQALVSLLSWSCMVSLFQFPVQWSIMMIVLVLLPALLYGLLVPFSKGAGFLMLYVIMLCCPAQLFYLDL